MTVILTVLAGDSRRGRMTHWKNYPLVFYMLLFTYPWPKLIRPDLISSQAAPRKWWAALVTTSMVYLLPPHWSEGLTCLFVFHSVAETIHTPDNIPLFLYDKSLQRRWERWSGEKQIGAENSQMNPWWLEEEKCCWVVRKIHLSKGPWPSLETCLVRDGKWVLFTQWVNLNGDDLLQY